MREKKPKAQLFSFYSGKQTCSCMSLKYCGMFFPLLSVLPKNSQPLPHRDYNPKPTERLASPGLISHNSTDRQEFRSVGGRPVFHTEAGNSFLVPQPTRPLSTGVSTANVLDSNQARFSDEQPSQPPPGPRPPPGPLPRRLLPAHGRRREPEKAPPL